ncbi:MAG TPA: aminoglycoside phosphotransferase family protein [Microbacterium sp.]|nr:aminoglycoside phosphotransferase family protein [Microbacterium sp.]
MVTRLHDDEPDTSPRVVRTLLRDQVPELAGLELERLSNTGSDNALYRLGSEFVVRLPRLSDAAGRLGVELSWLPRLAGLPVGIPEIVHAGEPTEAYPYRWAIVRWLVGVDAWDARHHEDWFGPDLGRDLAAVVRHLRGMDVADAPPREPGQRGGSLRALDDRVRRWLERADSLVDVPAVTRLWEECLEAATDELEPALVHGDLIPGNLLVADGRLTAVIDWGGLGAGDPAQDLDPAWSVLDAAGAAAFREVLDIDEQSWSRGRGFALEHAIGAIVYYVPRRHPLGAVMQRTLDRLLSRR